MEKYSIYSPKKDQFGICSSYNPANITEEEHKQHILLKTEARLEKNGDNEIALNYESTVVLYIDLQKVLLSSSIQASVRFTIKLNYVVIIIPFMIRKPNRQLVTYGLKQKQI